MFIHYDIYMRQFFVSLAISIKMDKEKIKKERIKMNILRKTKMFANLKQIENKSEIDPSENPKIIKLLEDIATILNNTSKIIFSDLPTEKTNRKLECDDYAETYDTPECFIMKVLNEITLEGNAVYNFELTADQSFIMNLTSIVRSLLYSIGRHTLDMKPYAEYFVEKINKVTNPLYVKLCCEAKTSEGGTPYYTCGRAIQEIFSHKFPKIMIYSTKNEYDDNTDEASFSRCIKSPEQIEGGYYKKYLKYKTKYLNEKKKLNK